ncbi:hypothetical protein S40285_06051 [Stachybotrys chlorohalonatus IBT 40285]|uniref:Stress-response A/B barrel domain-containing protein n=1 Tax=Stachybotrys chlorohalonatus (strain IBT 40285) TaxID=1283841 RepID=A0A084Q8R5_STAC4|nr:hypothetical protein S40285_06051 [Stachybotrys chlorohalonata IBT 40285]
MSITHTVFFHFKADTKPEDVKATVEGMFALKTKCVHAESQTPYIKSFKGGKDISIEGLQARYGI